MDKTVAQLEAFLKAQLVTPGLSDAERWAFFDYFQTLGELKQLTAGVSLSDVLVSRAAFAKRMPNTIPSLRQPLATRAQ